MLIYANDTYGIYIMNIYEHLYMKTSIGPLHTVAHVQIDRHQDRGWRL